LSVTQVDAVVTATASGQQLSGAGQNAFFVGAGNTEVLGGPSTGIGTAVFTGSIEQYSVTSPGAGEFTVTDSVAGRDGTTQLENIQQAQFSDVTLVLDLTSSQDMQVYELYQAAFDRLPDDAGFRFWAGVADSTQTSALSLADAFLASPEFAQRYGTDLSNAQYLTELYTKALNRMPDAAGFNFWLDEANAGVPRDQLLVDFATSPEDVQLIGPHVDHGFWTTH
jgi:hypothetical protein